MFPRRTFLVGLSIVVLAIAAACTTACMPDPRPECFCRPGMALRQFEIKDGVHNATYVPCINQCDKCLEKNMQISKYKILNLIIELNDADIQNLKKGDHIFECVPMSERVDIGVEIYYMGPLNYSEFERAKG